MITRPLDDGVFLPCVSTEAWAMSRDGQFVYVMSALGPPVVRLHCYRLNVTTAALVPIGVPQDVPSPVTLISALWFRVIALVILMLTHVVNCVLTFVCWSCYEQL